MRETWTATVVAGNCGDQNQSAACALRRRSFPRFEATPLGTGSHETEISEASSALPLDCASILWMRRGLLLAPLLVAAAARACRLQHDRRSGSRPGATRRAASDRAARLGRAVPGREAGTRLRRRVVQGHAKRLVGGHLGRQPVRRRLEDRRAERRGGAAVRADAVPDRRPEGVRAPRQHLQRACDPSRDELQPGAPGRARAGATWRGTISAPGALAGGLWVRISFGPFSSVGDPPKGVPAPVGHVVSRITPTSWRRSPRCRRCRSGGRPPS